jgi:hypothetical protein
MRPVLALIRAAGGARGEGRGGARRRAAVVLAAVAATGCLAVPDATTEADAAFGADGLVAHWPLDEASGTGVEDRGGAHPGLAFGSPVWLPEAGRIGGTLELDGVDDRVDIADDAAFVPGGESFSLAAWVRSNGNGVEATIFSKQKCPMIGEHIWHLGMWDDGRVYARLGDGDQLVLVTSERSYHEDAWHHVAVVVTREDTRATLYVDGGAETIEAGLETFGSIDDPAGNDVHIGAVTDCGGTVPWGGLIDDVRYYRRALDVEEIVTLASATSAAAGTSRHSEPTTTASGSKPTSR